MICAQINDSVAWSPRTIYTEMIHPSSAVEVLEAFTPQSAQKRHWIPQATPGNLKRPGSFSSCCVSPRYNVFSYYCRCVAMCSSLGGPSQALNRPHESGGELKIKEKNCVNRLCLICSYWFVLLADHLCSPVARCTDKVIVARSAGQASQLVTSQEGDTE